MREGSEATHENHERFNEHGIVTLVLPNLFFGENKRVNRAFIPLILYFNKYF